ncbi:MAG: DUF1553 domain-containing protein [Verrucomicrobiota bacterium]
MPKNPVCVYSPAIFSFLFVIASTAAEDKIDFNQQIRPILSENCYHCHGQDSEGRKGDLRLDLEEEAKKAIDGHIAFHPQGRGKSKAWQLMITEDSDERMPPLKSKRTLTAKQIELLGKWIDQGAHYAPHWAYIPPSRDASLRGPQAIDHFVAQQLKKQNLTAQAPADRRSLLRRVSLDLSGLPPSPAEIATFLSDKSDQAYEKTVDRLLASKRFGERWARPWLDAARYADSNGFQADQLRDSWAYRDWVIDALNTNMPFDQFTIEQLAGDLLPNATLSQKIATGFHRTVTCNVEAGVHPEENRFNQVIDRVNTTGTVWLGTTLACVQCHDHKYDPFSMKDYYGIFSFFNNTPLEVENPSGKGVSFSFYGPKMELPVAESITKKKGQLQARIKDLDKQRLNFRADKNAGRQAWENKMRDALQNPPKWQALKISQFKSTGNETSRILDDHSVLITGRLPDTTHYEIICDTRLSGITSFKLEALTHDELPGKGPGRGDEIRSNFVLTEFTVRASNPASPDEKIIELVAARADFSQENWPAQNAIDGNQKTGWAIAPQFSKDHWATFNTAKPYQASNTKLTFTLDQNYGRGRTLGRIRLSALTGDPNAVDIPKNIATILKLPENKRSKKQLNQLNDFYVKSNPALKKLESQLNQIKKQLESLPNPSTLVMIEMDKTRETHVMKRGNYLSPAEKVSAATPGSLHPFKAGLAKNRLGFAKWLMDPANPLVARVTVNRWWAELFGQGLVSTIEDFGTQSTPPTHPQLLDWLATEFMTSGWDMKHTLKTIVMSDTYRRDSKLTALLLEKDPNNRFYARGPRFRMSAEMIRDNALTVSGLLSTKMHGPPIMPYQPKGIWRQVGRNEPKWVEAKDENRFRRGVYVVWRRAAPYPSFVNFDAPDRSACLVKRPRTNTPLQALTLMNDPAYVEIALALAGRIILERPQPDISERIRHGFELVLGRQPKKQELNYLISVFQERSQRLKNDPKAAEEIIKNGTYIKLSTEVPATEMAAWFYIAGILLNLDETINKG